MAEVRQFRAVGAGVRRSQSLDAAGFHFASGLVDIPRVSVVTQSVAETCAVCQRPALSTLGPTAANPI